MSNAVTAQTNPNVSSISTFNFFAVVPYDGGSSAEFATVCLSFHAVCQHKWRM